MTFFEKHPELLFVLKALFLVGLLRLLENIFYIWWFGILLLAPFLIFLLFHIIAIHQNKSIVEVLRDNLTLIPAPYLERDEKYPSIPWATYSLIGINVFIFYGVMPSLPDDVLNNLLFAPAEITFLNTLIAQPANLFLHADGWHLWGNMAFLWAMGSVLEKRIGSDWLLGLYLAAGFASNLLYLLCGLLMFGYLVPSLGASGAISGLMGVFAVRCYFKTIVFPFPVLGLFSYLMPLLSLKVRMNALVVIGLFFWADLSSGVEQILGINSDNIAYGAHVGGLLTGTLLAWRMPRLANEAVQERRLDTARSSLNGQDWLDEDVGEQDLREYLQNNDRDSEALLLLARKISRYSLPEEGIDLYQKAILLLLKTDLDQAVAIFKEYFDKYQQPLPPQLQIRLAALIERSGNLDFAARSLEMLLSQDNLTSELRGKCLFHCARLCRKMGLEEAAEMYAQKQAEWTA